MRTVACVKAGTLYPAHYVNVLRDMVARHLEPPYRFVCLTDDQHGIADGIETVALTPGRVGWWNKVELFRPGLFEGRVLFSDLDQVVVGPLARFFDLRGIIYLQDWGWDHFSYCSSVMVWDAGEHARIWTDWTASVPGRLDGDQDWITQLGGWERLPQDWCRSYRYHAVAAPPPNSSFVCFHGKPKPHELPACHWASKVWRCDGLG